MRQEYDYVIVGAGSAGCVLAHRLSAKPDLKVLVLEAGEPEQGLYHKAPAAFPKLFKGPSDWAFYTAPQVELNGRELYWPRGKVLGGSSSINAMIVIRGNPRDYDDWLQPGWSFAEVLPYFKKLETHPLGPSAYHGDRGPLHVEVRKYTNPLTYAFIEAAQQWGLPRNDDFNGATQEGVGLFHVNQKNGARHSAASAYLRPALPRPNLDAQTGARAHRILFEGARAVGVEYRHHGQLWRVRARRGVVLSSGAVQSPQLLMLSGIGPAQHLQSHGLEVRQDLPVGQNLWDHLALPVIWHSKAPVSLDKAETLTNILRYLLTQRGPFVSNVAEAGAFLRTRPEA
ncbi:MAG: GMC family oxidoreductase N-terminal domain-containing protein, partial [Meiothermus sp.]|nr:GMC family oxidoreductase N-terminal domain-containing protein [Meiothermus sp.]